MNTPRYMQTVRKFHNHFYKNENAQFEIDDLYVFAEFQNQGIGSEIIKKCCMSAKGSVILYVFIKNERAVSLYKRLGFKGVETINNSRYIMKYSDIVAK